MREGAVSSMHPPGWACGPVDLPSRVSRQTLELCLCLVMTACRQTANLSLAGPSPSLIGDLFTKLVHPCEHSCAAPGALTMDMDAP